LDRLFGLNGRCSHPAHHACGQPEILPEIKMSARQFDFVIFADKRVHDDGSGFNSLQRRSLDCPDAPGLDYFYAIDKQRSRQTRFMYPGACQRTERDSFLA